jgi:transketolase
MAGRPTGKATRDGFGSALIELAREDERIVALSGDLEDSTRADYVKKEFPERFFTTGIAEQDMMGTAVGLALAGKIPFACTFACFSLRAVDQVRISVCYNEANVKLVGTHQGLTVGEDGATAQALEDVAIYRSLPTMTVVVPADFEEARKATFAAARHHGPVYLRFGRQGAPDITDGSTPFELGKANVLRDGSDVAIVATGIMVAEALDAADELASDGIEARVINLHTVKPIDRETILATARDCDCIVVLDQGRVVQQGTHDELMRSDGFYRSICEKQAVTAVGDEREEDDVAHQVANR